MICSLKTVPDPCSTGFNLWCVPKIRLFAICHPPLYFKCFPTLALLSCLNVARIANVSSGTLYGQVSILLFLTKNHLRVTSLSGCVTIFWRFTGWRKLSSHQIFSFFVTSFHWYILPVVLSQNVLSVLSFNFASSLYITVSWKLKLLMATNKTLKDSGICKISTDKAEHSYCNISSRFCKSDYQYFQKNSINCISAFFLSSNLLSVSFIGACCLPFRSIKVAKFWTTMMNFSNFPPSVSETEPPGKFCNAFLRLENVHKLNVFKMGKNQALPTDSLTYSQG